MLLQTSFSEKNGTNMLLNAKMPKHAFWRKKKLEKKGKMYTEKAY